MIRKNGPLSWAHWWATPNPHRNEILLFVSTHPPRKGMFGDRPRPKSCSVWWRFAPSFNRPHTAEEVEAVCATLARSFEEKLFGYFNQERICAILNAETRPL